VTASGDDLRQASGSGADLETVVTPRRVGGAMLVQQSYGFFSVHLFVRGCVLCGNACLERASWFGIPFAQTGL
jgi:hypothetical protein